MYSSITEYGSPAQWYASFKIVHDIRRAARGSTVEECQINWKSLMYKIIHTIINHKVGPPQQKCWPNNGSHNTYVALQTIFIGP
jgi:hypothetical protein